MVRACVVSLLLLATACPGPGTAVTSPGGGGPGSGSGPRTGGGSGSGHVDGGGCAVAIDNSCPAPGCVYHGGIVGGAYFTCLSSGAGSCFHFGARCAPALLGVVSSPSLGIGLLLGVVGSPSGLVLGVSGSLLLGVGGLGVGSGVVTGGVVALLGGGGSNKGREEEGGGEEGVAESGHGCF